MQKYKFSSGNIHVTAKGISHSILQFDGLSFVCSSGKTFDMRSEEAWCRVGTFAVMTRDKTATGYPNKTPFLLFQYICSLHFTQVI